VRAIYLSRYWKPAQCGDLPAGVSLFHFDAAVNHGVSGAVRLLQRALNVDPDGEIGPVTRTQIRRADPAALIERYGTQREIRYRALPHFWRFGRGWLNRVAATKTVALSQIGRAAKAAPASSSRSTQGDDAMSDAATPAGKWWGNSLTVWGSFITAAAAILPAIGPIIGLDISSDTIKQLGSDVGDVVQAVAGILGTLMTIYGRARATAPLVRREMNVRL
jgi:lysozyme family protein